jgi:hypothetical protein
MDTPCTCTASRSHTRAGMVLSQNGDEEERDNQENPRSDHYAGSPLRGSEICRAASVDH